MKTKNDLVNKMGNVFLFLYLFFLSFLNFTPFYLISAMLLIVLTGLKIIKKRKVILTKYFYFEIAFIFFNILYVVFEWSINNKHTLDAIKTITLNLLINIAVMNTIEDKVDLKKNIKWFIPIATFSCIYIILYSGGQGDAGRLAHGIARPFGDTTYTSMEFASWALYAGTFALFSFFETKEKKYLIPFPLFWVVIVWAGSRKCIVFGIILQLLVYLFCNQNRKNIMIFIKRCFEISIIVLVAIILILKNAYLYNLVGYRFVGYFEQTESSSITRNDMKEIAITYIKANPIKGYGLNTFRDVSIYETWSESNYLELAFGGGIFLVVCYYLFLIYLVISLFKIRKKDKINMLFMLVLMLLIFFDTVSMSYQGRLETFLITICSLLIYFDKKEKRKKV